ncbi:unnamed protein product [Porites evermanni]|uniref:Caveolin n=1 Tax=Porites evermanni TaxID=104178 RepID=A0ABN8LBI8_9CNID|nr:unnamed protein product [Porites evermanni]
MTSQPILRNTQERDSRDNNEFFKASSTFESRRLLPELDMKSQPTQEDFQDDRDPRGNNDYIQVAYSDVICEPPATHSPQCSYQFTKAVYANTSNLTYSILTLLFGGPLSFIYGLSCGVISFFFVWLVTPFVRAWFILFGLAGKLWMSIVKSFYNPLFEAFGRFFSNINITLRSSTIQNV